MHGGGWGEGRARVLPRPLLSPLPTWIARKLTEETPPVTAASASSAAGAPTQSGVRAAPTPRRRTRAASAASPSTNPPHTDRGMNS